MTSRRWRGVVKRPLTPGEWAGSSRTCSCARSQPTARLYALERLGPAFHTNAQLATLVPILQEQMELLKLQLTVDVITATARSRWCGRPARVPC